MFEIVYYSIRGADFSVVSAAGNGQTLVSFLEENRLEVICQLAPGILLAKRA